METQTIFHALLVLHIIGFAALTGCILADFAISRKLARYIFSDRPKAIAIFDSASALPKIIIIGALTLIVTGPIMVILTHGVISEMLWFKLKMPLVILLLLNAIVIGRPSGMKLGKLINQSTVENDMQITKVLKRISRFEMAQLAMILIIIVLSAFQFN